MKKASAEKQSAVLGRLMKYVKPHALLVVAAFLCAVVSAAATLFAPVVIGDSVNFIMGAGRVYYRPLAARLVLLAVLIVAVLVFQWLMNLFAQRAAHLTVRDVRRDGFSSLVHAPLSYIDGNGHGDLASRLSVDADQISDGIVQGATQLFTGIVTVIGTLALMIRINPWIALAVAGLTPLSLFVSFLVARGSHKYFSAQSKVRGELYQKSEETIGARALVAAYGYAHRAERSFNDTNESLRNCGFKATFYSSLVNPSTRLINALVYAVAAVMGAVFAIDGKMTAGDIATLLLFANQFARPINEITGVITELQTSLAAAKRTLDLAEVKPQSDSGTVTDKKLSGEIALNNMTFSYTEGKPILKNLSLEVAKGTMVAIVGRTGCGKTTLINLLMRFYDPDSGTILFDGINSADIQRSCVRKGFGMVLQDSWIFKGTVRENIAYGKPEATLDDVKAAARAAHIDGFIERLPNGYDTVIDDGDGISQGQKQLINIARVMLVNPPMLILDEATSNIDTRTERRVQEAFDSLLRPKDGVKKTGFVVAHRLSTIKNADVILVMDKGEIVERGTHDELLALGGVYAELYNAQFSGGLSV
ncbi:MAG: ABC transporter ATP-binding protein [Clostridiales bacterium]|nr:ABC transporter ATP-binding protein [Clostridiales bacterium]